MTTMDTIALDTIQVNAFLDAKHPTTGVIDGEKLQELRFGVRTDGSPYVLAIMANHAGVLLKPRIRV